MQLDRLSGERATLPGSARPFGHTCPNWCWAVRRASADKKPACSRTPGHAWLATTFARGCLLYTSPSPRD
eukprot:13947442-Alexandrium_andersonii.AAC.1